MAHTRPFTPRVICSDPTSPPPHSNHFSQPSSVPYYPIAGRLSWSHAGGGRWELHCNAKGAHFYQAFCHSTLDDLADFVPSQIVQQLIPPIDYGCPIAQVPLLAVQLTRFSCGGLTVGVAMCRAVIDGTAAMRFVSSRAKLARGEVLDSMEMPFHDRTELDSRKLNTEPRFEHSKFHPPPLSAGSLGGSEGETKTFIAILKPTRYQVNKVKKKVDAFASRYKRPCSSFEVISGHVWRCVSKARYAGGGDDHPTRLSTLANCRNLLKPALPSNCAGNAAFPTVTPTCSFNALMHKPLSYAVEKVREALEGLTDEYVRSALGYIEREKEMKVVRYNFHYPVKSVLEKGEFRGNSNLFVVRWMNFSYREADFGWGKPVYFGPASLSPKAKAFVLNNADGDGVIVAIRLQALQMDPFKRLFFEDIEDDFPISKL
ncbi:hydroxycinnamoyl-CoA:piscidic acid hydroxycinnamoyltransferase-like [Prosopis cineraria]|uniref:hydroxycinnamoyl-CoA:piscidic acid hydroxycinnamoyltransferase-like n=1 Tax=Prosopis cineraria TaxID=364024 RepID=UPI00240F51E0|nr:hydroxycinnamoyl-CoA:piscidic acid hydroxycinnamoyltransferase-like [Prosopis cineraria]